MMKTTLIILVALLAGCSALREKAIDLEAPEKAAKAVDLYGESIPFRERVKNRDAINALTNSCDIEVTCIGDPQ